MVSEFNIGDVLSELKNTDLLGAGWAGGWRKVKVVESTVYSATCHISLCLPLLTRAVLVLIVLFIA